MLGKVPTALSDGFADAQEAHEEHTGSEIKPGATGRSVYEAHAATFMQAKGLQPSRRVYAHGQGYDLVERPLIREDEPMTLEPGMVFAVHPIASAGGYAAFICDDCVIGADGATTWLHRMPKRVFEAGRGADLAPTDLSPLPARQRRGSGPACAHATPARDGGADGVQQREGRGSRSSHAPGG